MVGPDVPPAPASVGPPWQEWSRLSRQLRAQASEADAAREKYDHNRGVQSQAHLLRSVSAGLFRSGTLVTMRTATCGISGTGRLARTTWK